MKRWWGFVVFALVGALHLVALFVGWYAVSVPTKWMLMPALLVALLVGLPHRRSEVTLWGSLGILFSWAGDVLLASPGDLGFFLGLGGFLVAHVMYLVLFARPLRTRRLPVIALFYVGWWLVLVLVLAPHLGQLLIPVAIYGLVLGAAAAFALGTNRITAVGGLLFALSDTTLAFTMFYPGFAIWQQDFVIMVLYIVGQGLIILGAVRQVRARVAA